MKEDLKDHLIKFEGLVNKPYECTSGKLSIGVGRNLEDNGITTDEALFLLDNDINNVLTELKAQFVWFESAPENAKLVLSDMCFNLGLPTLLTFKKMLLAFAEQDWDEAAKQILDSKYAKQVGRRAIYNASLIEAIMDDKWVNKSERT